MTYGDDEPVDLAFRTPRLDQFAPEIIQDISRHLTPSSRLALALSCRRFYDQLSIGLPHWRRIHDDVEQYQYLVVLEHFGFDVGPFVACAGCQSVHFRSWFSSDQLALKPGQRQCLKKARRFWVEPHKYLSFEELQNSASIFQVNDLKYTISNFLQAQRDTDRIWGDSVVSKIKLLTVPDGFTISQSKLGQILRRLDVPTCPHIRFSDDIVVNNYVPEKHCVITEGETHLPRCQRKSSIPVSDDYDFECAVEDCITRFRWHIEREPDGEWKTLYLSVRRYVGDLYNYTDKWLHAQLMCPKEGFDEYAEACYLWKDSNIGRQKEQLASQMSALPQEPGNNRDTSTSSNSCFAMATGSSGNIGENQLNDAVPDAPHPPSDKMYEPIDVPPPEDKSKASISRFNRRYEGLILPPWQGNGGF